MIKCEHEKFDANVDVTRLTKTDGGPVTGYLAEIKIRCIQCGTPFAFKGLPMGLNLGGAAVDIDRLTANLSIEPTKPTIS
jgi:hypothetical protein